MRIPILHTVTLLALTAFTALAFADAPTRVGRLSLTQGEVSISANVGEQTERALVNWPVTSQTQITTGRDARTEIRVGSTALRLDADSALEVVELDDDHLRLHLHYGSISVRVRNPDVLRGFELSTPQGRVRLQEPGRIRVDAERQRDTSVVNVFDGVAVVDGGGASLTLRAGRRAEIVQDDVRTALAVRDSFDDWSMLRDRQDERVTAERYVTREMTGYEDLDRYGIWRDDREYGPLWLPRSVPSGWAPYRDGRWAWIAPWGWTWVDNAPWGYAPFHYGRWVLVNSRWCWAPGRNIGNPVWAPALVGWVGGSGWSLTFGSGAYRRAAPAQGWYPLAPREPYVPGYRLGHEHLRYINRDARDDHRGDGRDLRRREGLTVVPHDQFAHQAPIVVRNAPRAVVPPVALQTAPVTAPPAPNPAYRERGRAPREDGRGDRDTWRNRDQRGVQAVAPAPQAPAAAPALPVQQPAVTQPLAPRREWRAGPDEHRGFDDPRRARPPQPAPQPAAPQPAPVLAAPQPAPARPPAAEPAQQPRLERPGRGFRGDLERERHEPEGAPRQGGQPLAPPIVRQAPMPQQPPAPPPIVRQAPMPQQPPAPPPIVRQAPMPQQPPAPPPVARPAPMPQQAQAPVRVAPPPAAQHNPGASQEAHQRRNEERSDRNERNERNEKGERR